MKKTEPSKKKAPLSRIFSRNTCEQYRPADCQERAAPPTQHGRELSQEFIRAAISKVIETESK